MSVGPEQNIEQRLKAYAETRRRQAGEPLALPAETRRTLRAEIERRWGESARMRLRARWWEGFWPKLGWAVGGLAALTIAALVLVDTGRGRTKSMRLADARRDTGSLNPVRERAEPAAPAPEVRGDGELERVARPALEGAKRAEAEKEAPVPPAVAGTPPLPSATPARADKSPSFGTRGATATAAPPPLPDLAPGAPVTPGVAFQPVASNASEPQPAAEPQANFAMSRGLAAKAGAAERTPAQPDRFGASIQPSVPSPVMVKEVGAAGPTDAALALGTAGRETTVRLTATTGAEASAAGKGALTPQSMLTQERRFVQTTLGRPYRRNLNSPPQQPVLQDFIVQQVGNDLRIADQDGSVYVANVAPPPSPQPAKAKVLQPASAQMSQAIEQAAAPARATSARARPVPSVATSTPDQNAQPSPEALGAVVARSEVEGQQNLASNELAFDAVGTNRSLNQRVVFNGRLVFTNTALALPAKPDPAANNPEALAIWLDNSVVQGQAVVGDRTRVDVRAFPAN